VQRYHPRIVGGLEEHAGHYATLLAERYDVDLLTTCAENSIAWKKALPEAVQTRQRQRHSLQGVWRQNAGVASTPPSVAPRLSPDGRPAAPGTPCNPTPPLSRSACPGRPTPRHAVLRAAAASRR
jgi:hypothetical protein